MRTSEWIVVSYFSYLSLLALGPRWSIACRVRVWGCAAAISVGVLILARAPQTGVVVFLRDWMPGAHIILAYYVTGFFVDRPSAAQEAWLQAWNARLPSLPTACLPGAVRAYLELAYNGGGLLVPAGFAVLTWIGHHQQADHYWTLVTASECGAFASLPWFQTRPPWIVENLEPTPALGLQRVNFMWLRRTSLCMNTFPSGHAAGTLAVALAVMPWAPLAGLALFALAVSVALASVVGRYHYALDAVSGLALASLMWSIGWLAHV